MLIVLVEIPFYDCSSLISKDDRSFIRVQDSTVDRSVVVIFLHYFFGADVEDAEAAILAGSVDELVFFAEAPYCVDVALEAGLEDFTGSVGFGYVKYFCRIEHADCYFFFAFIDLDADGGCV